MALAHAVGEKVEAAYGRDDMFEERRRARLELRGRALLNQLSNEFLEIAIEQLSVLSKRDRRPGTD
jgi:hypothetical protein